MPAIIDRSGPERVIVDAVAAESVAAEAERLGARRVMCVVSSSLRKRTDEIAAIERALGSRHATTFSDVHAHTPISDVLEAIAVARGVSADLVVTVGGGALTDAGKDIALGIKAGVVGMDDVPAWRETYRWGKGEASSQTAPDVRVVCVPTTLSGGEHNCVGGAWHPELGKFGLEHRSNTPATVIYDPHLVRHTPDWLWLSTGMRAIDHAVETLASSMSNAYYDAVAEGALRLLAVGLPDSKRNPENVAAQTQCQIGAWQAVTPLIAGVPMGASHAISHALGAVGEVPHGYTSCVLLPAVMRWNAPVAQDRLRRVSAALGAAEAPAHELLEGLIRSLGLPGTLQEVGVEPTPQMLQRIAELTLGSPFYPTNPREIGGASGIVEILELIRAP